MPSVAAGHTVWPGAPGQPSFAIPSEMRRAGSPMISAASAISSISGRSGSASENSGAMRHFSAHKMRVRTWVLRELLNSRSEEHTSELQSRFDLVCRLLLEKKKKLNRYPIELNVVFPLVPLTEFAAHGQQLFTRVPVHPLEIQP